MPPVPTLRRWQEKTTLRPRGIITSRKISAAALHPGPSPSWGAPAAPTIIRSTRKTAPSGGNTIKNNPVRKFSQLVSASSVVTLSQRTPPAERDSVSVMATVKSTSGQGRSSKPPILVTTRLGLSKDSEKLVRWIGPFGSGLPSKPPWLLVPGVESRPVDQARIDEEDDRFPDLKQAQPLQPRSRAALPSGFTIGRNQRPMRSDWF